MGEESEQFRKIFIGGLHYQTTDESLRQFYEKWGEVVDCVVMRDPYTRKSRGFGFITYSRAENVDICLDARPHVIDGKQVDPKRAMPREDSNKPEAHLAVKKIFVGGVKEAISDEDLRNYFCSFGNVQSVEMIADRETGRKRGFGFITFDDYDTVDKIVLRKNHIINGLQIEVKKAMEKDQMNSMSTRGGGSGGGSGGRGSFAGRGGGRGRGAAGAARGRGGGSGGGYGASDGYGSGAGGYGADGYGSGGYGASSYGGASGYGGGYSDGYGSGYGGGSGGWGQGGGYGNGYSSGGTSGGAGFGSGYSGSYGGGAMKSSGGYSQRGSGPYGGGYGSGSGGGYGGGTGGYGGGYGGGY